MASLHGLKPSGNIHFLEALQIAAVLIMLKEASLKTQNKQSPKAKNNSFRSQSGIRNRSQNQQNRRKAQEKQCGSRSDSFRRDWR